MRLDVFLFEKCFFSSREKAKQAVKSGDISVNGMIALKASQDVSEPDRVEVVKQTNPFVGRGGLKLQGAIEHFKLDLNGCTALDIGASTGGFTDCMLKTGVKLVYACDVGRDQLVESLKQDKRVVSLENTDIRVLAADPAAYGIDFKFDFIAVDVSFISITKILPCLKSLLSANAILICLIKPQFELNAKKVGKNGVVKDTAVQRQVCENIREFALNAGYCVKGIIESPIKGGDGNREFLMCLN